MALQNSIEKRGSSVAAAVVDSENPFERSGFYWPKDSEGKYDFTEMYRQLSNLAQRPRSKQLPSVLFKHFNIKELTELFAQTFGFRYVDLPGNNKSQKIVAAILFIYVFKGYNRIFDAVSSMCPASDCVTNYPLLNVSDTVLTDTSEFFLQELPQTIFSMLSAANLGTLAFFLAIDWEDMSGATTEEMLNSFLSKVVTQKKVGRLKDELKKIKPDFAWETLFKE